MSEANLSAERESPEAGSADGSAELSPRDRGSVRRFGDVSVRYAMVWILAGLVVAAQLSYSQFLTFQNLKNMLTQNASLGVVAVGMTMVLIAGGFDLSVVGTFSLGSVLFAGLCQNSGFEPASALPLVLCAGAACGLVNGLILTKLRVNAFVTTLATSVVFDGIAFLYSNSTPITVGAVPNFGYIGSGSILGIPVPIVILGVLFALGGLLLAKTTYGRRLYATGGNIDAARLAGLRIDRIRIVAFMICGLTATLAGAILSATISTGQPDQMPNIALESIAAVIIGGTSLFGGEGTMWRTAVGVLILATLNNLFSSLAVSTPVQDIVTGAVLIVAVTLETASRRRRR